jgi:hypothetical protein
MAPNEEYGTVADMRPGSRSDDVAVRAPKCRIRGLPWALRATTGYGVPGQVVPAPHNNWPVCSWT